MPQAVKLDRDPLLLPKRAPGPVEVRRPPRPSNYTYGKYQFAFLAYHMLTMSCVYFRIWQIKQTQPKAFEMAMVGFNKDLERELLGATSPFTFWRVNESSVLRFLKLIGCDNAEVGNYAALVKERNDTAHSNGNIFFSTQAALDDKINEIPRVVDEIQSHSGPVIEDCYREFLLQNCDPDEREYPDAGDQIREVLIHVNYFSQKDIEVCLACDVSGIGEGPQQELVGDLHAALSEEYGQGAD